MHFSLFSLFLSSHLNLFDLILLLLISDEANSLTTPFGHEATPSPGDEQRPLDDPPPPALILSLLLSKTAFAMTNSSPPSPFMGWAMLFLATIFLALINASEAQVAAQNRLLRSEAIVPMKTHSIYARKCGFCLHLESSSNLTHPFSDCHTYSLRRLRVS